MITNEKNPSRNACWEVLYVYVYIKFIAIFSSEDHALGVGKDAASEAERNKEKTSLKRGIGQDTTQTTFSPA